MGLFSWMVKKAVTTATTKTLIRSIADAAVDTIHAVGEAKARSDRRVADAGEQAAAAPQPAAVPPARPVPLQSTCTQCGANLRMVKDRTEIYCEYCGARNYYVMPGYGTPPAPAQPASGETPSRVNELEKELRRVRAERDAEKARNRKSGGSCLAQILRTVLLLALLGAALMVVLVLIVVFVLIR